MVKIHVFFYSKKVVLSMFVRFTCSMIYIYIIQFSNMKFTCSVHNMYLYVNSLYILLLQMCATPIGYSKHRSSPTLECGKGKIHIEN